MSEKKIYFFTIKKYFIKIDKNYDYKNLTHRDPFLNTNSFAIKEFNKNYYIEEL